MNASSSRSDGTTPKKKLWTAVPELQDERQAHVLYSPFREKSLNPHSWNRKLTFWENVLFKTFTEQRVISFDSKSLPAMFERNGLTPKCLTTVMDEMERSGQLQSISRFEKKDSWLSWGFNALVKQPLIWGVSHLLSSASKKEDDIYVCPKVVKAVASEVLQQHRSRLNNSLDNVMSLGQLQAHCRHLIPDERDFKIVLTYLEKERGIAVVEAEDGEVIVKFRTEGESAASFKEIDLNLYSIKTTTEKLEKDIHLLSSRVNENVAEARLNVKAGNKRLALINLRRKASLVKMIDRKSGSLATLHDILHKIEDAKTNEMVVKACETGVQAMKALNQDLTAQRADTVMDELQETITDQEEINDILCTSISQFDDDELEKDLAKLLEEDSQAQQSSPEVPKLPVSDSVDPCGSTQDDKTCPVSDDKTCPVPDDIAAAFMKLEINNIDLPDVPSHSPSKDNTKDANTTSKVLLPSSYS